jgi:hypothetical protein
MSGQALSENLIVTDTKDSLLIKATKTFDKNGNYCFDIMKNGKQFYITATDTFEDDGGWGGKEGEIIFSKKDEDPDQMPFFYRNGKGIKTFGPAVGKAKDFITTGTRDHIGLETQLNDSIYHYLDGRLIDKNDVKVEYYDWCAFSENGNSLYYTYNNGWYKLKLNQKLIDSSKFRYSKLSVNNRGDYIYAEGYRPDKPVKGYDYMFYVHSRNSKLGYVRTEWESYLNGNGAYYFTGDDNGPSYLAINNRLYKNLLKVGDISIFDTAHFLFSYEDMKFKSYLSVSDKTYDLDFEKIYYPAIDGKGNFAFYGLKNYYIYKCVNGKVSDLPITGYQVRPIPLFISPTGESIHVFKTDDSIYLYRDDKLILKPIASKSKFKLALSSSFVPGHYYNADKMNSDSLFYMVYDTCGYIVFNGKFSKPMIPFSNTMEADSVGDLITADINEHGFYTIQKTGAKKFFVDINNTVYQEIVDVDQIVPDNSFFDGKEFVFYAVKGLSIYRYKISL